MITATRELSGIRSIAVFSDCLQYRYSLSRRWCEIKPLVHFVMLNPSTADEAVNDPTVERCQRRAMAMNYGGFIVTNLFPLRSTDPAGLIEHPTPLGDPMEANNYIKLAAICSKVTICAWGNYKGIKGRDKEVIDMLNKMGFWDRLRCLGVNRDGSPKHPLYVAYAQQPIQYPPNGF